MVDYPDTEGAVWNFDDKENALLFDLKLRFVNSIKDWNNLEQAYWDLDLLIMESDALLPETSRKDVLEKFNLITNYRKENNNYINSVSANYNNVKSEYYIMLRDLYMEICRKIVDEGAYFRKKKAYTGL